MPKAISLEEAQEVFDTYQKHGSRRATAEAMNKPEAWVQRRYNFALQYMGTVKPASKRTVTPGRKHIIIPDTQCRPGVSLEHMAWAGRYIAEKKPDVVVHLGDNWDMPSLSSYDKGKLDFEGRRYKHDIEAGNRGMALLNEHIGDTRKIFLLGNHEERIERACQNHPELDGLIGYHDFNLEGWEIQKYLRPIIVDGIAYSHYFYNGKTGKPWGGTAANMLKHVGRSFVMGHRQGLDTALLDLPTGERHRGIIAGSFYQHDEKYLGHQGNHHWRGILVLHEVENGNFDLLEVSLGYLRRRYGGVS